MTTHSEIISKNLEDVSKDVVQYIQYLENELETIRRNLREGKNTDSSVPLNSKEIFEGIDRIPKTVYMNTSYDIVFSVFSHGVHWAEIKHGVRKNEP